MSRATFVWDPTQGRVVPKSENARAYSAKPYSDACEVRSQIDVRVFTSKAGLRRQYRDAGVIEVGNERMERGTADLGRVGKDDIRRIVAEHRNGRR